MSCGPATCGPRVIRNHIEHSTAYHREATPSLSSIMEPSRTRMRSDRRSRPYPPRFLASVPGPGQPYVHAAVFTSAAAPWRHQQVVSLEVAAIMEAEKEMHSVGMKNNIFLLGWYWCARVCVFGCWWGVKTFWGLVWSRRVVVLQLHQN